MNKKYFLSFLLNLSFFVIFSQNEIDKFNNLQTDFFIGKPIEHDKKLDNAIQGNSYGFLLSWNENSTKNSKFNTLFNYPERGYSLLYQNFNSSVLGEVYGGYRHFTYKLNPTKENPLKLTTAFGLGYVTKKYDAIYNDQNIAIGSNLVASAFVKLQYFQFLVNKKIHLNTGLSLLHFSNASLKNPNLGINTVSLHFGLNYALGTPKNIPSKPRDSANFISQQIKYNLVIRSGFNESLIIDSGLYPFYTVSFYGSRQMNIYSTLTSGLDFFDSKFLKHHISYINLEEGKNYNEDDYRRAGIFVGHELTQNNFAFISQIGYTFYAEYPYISRIYERFGFKYKLNEHLFTEITMKVNLFRAEALEFGIGYKF